jgi:type I restriction enzyme, S subunit
LQNGRAFKPTEWCESGTPIIRIQNLNDELKPFNYCGFEVERRFHVQSGDLLFSWSGTPGTSFGAFFWNRGRGFLNQHIFRVDLDETLISKEYLRMALNSQLPVIMGHAHGGVGLQHITKGKLESVEIPLPPLPEQRRIAAILDKAEALRTKRREALAQLDRLAQSIFVEMFGDPVANPKRYPMVPLLELVEPERGIAYGIVQRGVDCEDGVPVLRIKDLTDDQIDVQALKRTSPAISAQYRRTVLKGGEIAISIRGTVGRCCIVPKALTGGNVSREIALVPLRLNTSPVLVLQVLRSPSVQRLIADEVKGVAQSGINLEDLRQLLVVQPPDEDVKRYEANVAVVARLLRDAGSALSNLDQLVAALQYRAFRGEL